MQHHCWRWGCCDHDFVGVTFARNYQYQNRGWMNHRIDHFRKRVSIDIIVRHSCSSRGEACYNIGWGMLQYRHVMVMVAIAIAITCYHHLHLLITYLSPSTITRWYGGKKDTAWRKNGGKKDSTGRPDRFEKDMAGKKTAWRKIWIWREKRYGRLARERYGGKKDAAAG